MGKSRHRHGGDHVADRTAGEPRFEDPIVDHEHANGRQRDRVQCLTERQTGTIDMIGTA